MEKKEALTSKNNPGLVCSICGGRLPERADPRGRSAHYCSASCRREAARRREAAQIAQERADAHAKGVTAGRAQGRREGYESGYAAGVEDGRAQERGELPRQDVLPDAEGQGLGPAAARALSRDMGSGAPLKKPPRPNS